MPILLPSTQQLQKEGKLSGSGVCLRQTKAINKQRFMTSLYLYDGKPVAVMTMNATKRILIVLYARVPSRATVIIPLRTCSASFYTSTCRVLITIKDSFLSHHQLVKSDNLEEFS